MAQNFLPSIVLLNKVEILFLEDESASRDFKAFSY